MYTGSRYGPVIDVLVTSASSKLFLSGERAKEIPTLRPGSHDPLQRFNLAKEAQPESVMPEADRPICGDEIIALTLRVSA